MAKLWNYIARLWSAFSQFLNVLLCNGHPNESISGRCYREPWPRTMKVVNAMFFWQKRHCQSAYESDLRWAKDYVASDSKEAL